MIVPSNWVLIVKILIGEHISVKKKKKKKYYYIYIIFYFYLFIYFFFYEVDDKLVCPIAALDVGLVMDTCTGSPLGLSRRARRSASLETLPAILSAR